MGCRQAGGCLLPSPAWGWLGFHCAPRVSWEYCPHGKRPGFPPDSQSSGCSSRRGHITKPQILLPVPVNSKLSFSNAFSL